MSHYLTSLVPPPISNSLASRKSLPTGYSLIYPLPPKSWMASSAAETPWREAYKKIAAESVLEPMPLSNMTAP